MTDRQAALDAIYDQFDDAELEALRLAVVALRERRPFTVAEAAARAKWEALGGPAAFEAMCVAAHLATMPAAQAMAA